MTNTYAYNANPFDETASMGTDLIKGIYIF